MDFRRVSPRAIGPARGAPNPGHVSARAIQVEESPSLIVTGDLRRPAPGAVADSRVSSSQASRSLRRSGGEDRRRRYSTRSPRRPWAHARMSLDVAVLAQVGDVLRFGLRESMAPGALAIGIPDRQEVEVAGLRVRLQGRVDGCDGGGADGPRD